MAKIRNIFETRKNIRKKCTTDLIMLFKAGQISMTLREWDDSTYDVTNNLVAENGRKSQKYAKNVIFYRFSVPKM